MYTTSSICCTGEGQSGCGQVRTEVVNVPKWYIPKWYSAYMYRSTTCTEVVQISNLAKNLYRSGMYRNGHVPNWP